MNDSEKQKRAAAEVAAQWIEASSVVGIGTGSTVKHLIDVIAERRSRGELRDIVGVPTSEATRSRCEELGIPLGDLQSHPRIDIAIDGADEVAPNLDLIKGLGAALLREKLVAIDAASFIVMVDSSKRVQHLGERAPVPVEVDPFGIGIQMPFLRQFGCDARVRMNRNVPLITDGGNIIVDCFFDSGIPDPEGFALELDRRPGILEHGLFLNMTERVVVAGQEEIEVLERNGDR